MNGSKEQCLSRYHVLILWFGFQRDVAAQPQSKAPLLSMHLAVSQTFCLSNVQNSNGGPHGLQSETCWGEKEPRQVTGGAGFGVSYPGLKFSLPSRGKIA